MNPLAEQIRAAASRARDSVVADRRTAVSLADAVRRAEDVAAAVLRVSARRDPVVAVELRSSVDAVVHVLGAVLGDYTLCLVDPAGGAPRRDAVLAAVDPDVRVDSHGIGPLRRRHPGRWSGGYVAMSSGSTGGAPKGVLSTWACLADFVPHGAGVLQLDSSACWAEPSHPAYDLAMTNWLMVLATGASLHVSGSLADRLRPLGMAARVGATHVRLAPRFIELATSEHQRGTTAPLRVWGSGGDRLSPRQARKVFGLGVPTLVNTYGSSETAGFASAATITQRDTPVAVHGALTVGAGSLGGWAVEAMVETIDGQPQELLAVRSPHLAGQYLFGGEEQQYPRWEPDRLVTGDLGTWAGGELFCLGRAGRLVKRSASFVNLDEVDVTLRSHRGLATYTVVTRAGALVTLVEGQTQQQLTDVRAGLTSLLAPEVVPDALVPVAKLPLLHNGKADQAGALAIAEHLVG
jgi:acyl-CoA synthetase (AMP-forming)/AMP-acid ligase II